MLARKKVIHALMDLVLTLSPQKNTGETGSVADDAANIIRLHGTSSTVKIIWYLVLVFEDIVIKNYVGVLKAEEVILTAFLFDQFAIYFLILRTKFPMF